MADQASLNRRLSALVYASAAVITVTAWLVLTQLQVDVTLCGQLGETGFASCLGGPTQMSLWDYLTHSRYPEYTYVLD